MYRLTSNYLICRKNVCLYFTYAWKMPHSVLLASGTPKLICFHFYKDNSYSLSLLCVRTCTHMQMTFVSQDNHFIMTGTDLYIPSEFFTCETHPLYSLVGTTIYTFIWYCYFHFSTLCCTCFNSLHAKHTQNIYLCFNLKKQCYSQA